MFPFLHLFLLTLTNDSMTLSVQVLMEIHTRKSASVQDDWEEQLCGAL